MIARALLVAGLLVAFSGTTFANEDPLALPPGVHALRAPNGVACDPNQFTPLEQTIGSARVVALGEASHGSRTIFRAKACTVRFLVEEMGFRLIAFEGNVNLLAHEEDLEQAFVDFTSSIYAMESILDLFKWVRAREDDGVRIVRDGFDIRTSPEAIDRVLDLLKAVDAAQAERIRPAFEGIRSFDVARWVEDAEAWLHQARDLLAHLQANEEAYEKEVAERRVQQAIQDVRRIVQHLEDFVSGGPGRDEHMAQNVLQLLDRYPNERLVLWAHNNHVRESRYLYPEATTEMGQSLSEALGEDYVSIAYTFGTGAYTATATIASRENPVPELGTHETEPPMEGTIEATLQGLNWSSVLVLFDALDETTRERLGLREPPQAMRSLGHNASRDAYKFYDLPGAFDALVYLEHSLPSIPVIAP